MLPNKIIGVKEVRPTQVFCVPVSGRILGDLAKSLSFEMIENIASEFCHGLRAAERSVTVLPRSIRMQLGKIVEMV